MSERTGDMTSHAYLRSWVGQEYNSCDLLFGIDKIWILTSGRVTGLKKNESFGEFDFLRYSGAPNENIVQNHLNIALLNVF